MHAHFHQPVEGTNCNSVTGSGSTKAAQERKTLNLTYYNHKQDGCLHTT